jgi:hypothetical protein
VFKIKFHTLSHNVLTVREETTPRAKISSKNARISDENFSKIGANFVPQI